TVEVHVGGAVMDAGAGDAPVLADVGETEVGVVPEDVVFEGRGGHFLDEFPHSALVVGGFLLVLVGVAGGIFDEVEGRHVGQGAVGYENVLPAVVVVVRPQGRPDPVGAGHTRELTHLAKNRYAAGVHAVVELERVA